MQYSSIWRIISLTVITTEKFAQNGLFLKKNTLQYLQVPKKIKERGFSRMKKRSSFFFIAAFLVMAMLFSGGCGGSSSNYVADDSPSPGPIVSPDPTPSPSPSPSPTPAPVSADILVAEAEYVLCRYIRVSYDRTVEEWTRCCT